MSFISEKIAEQKAKKEYTIPELENILVEHIVRVVKGNIKAAIEKNESRISLCYEGDGEGSVFVHDMYEPMDSFIKYSSISISQLSDIICGNSEASYADENTKRLINAVRDNEKLINLTNVEGLVQKEVLALGAKRATIYIRYCRYHTVIFTKPGFFKNHEVEEQRPLNKFKICFEVSW